MKTLILILALAIPSVGCTAILSSLPDVIAVVTEAGQVLDAIAVFLREYFAKHPNAELESKVDEAMAKCRTALNLALRSAKGATDKSADEAFADFRAAYADLLALVKPLGVKSGHDAAMRATPGELVVPEPLAVHR